MRTKDTNIGAIVFGIINRRDTEIGNLNSEIDKMNSEIQDLETASNNASASGDFDTFKECRSKLTEAKDLKDAYLNRVNYLNNHLPISDAEADEIKRSIEAAINDLDASIVTEMKKLAPKLYEAKTSYEKKHDDIMEIFNAWNDIAMTSDHQANYYNPRILPDIDMILRIIKKYSDKG